MAELQFPGSRRDLAVEKRGGYNHCVLVGECVYMCVCVCVGVWGVGGVGKGRTERKWEGRISRVVFKNE